MRAAFVVGANGPETLGRLARLTFAESDAARFAMRIRQPDLNFKVAARRRGRGSGTLLQRFEALATELDSNDDLLFYFAGHGIVRHGELFMVLNETQAPLLNSSALPWANIKQIVKQSNAGSKLVILDCCHAGEAVDNALGISYRGGFDSESINAAQRGSTASLLLACGPDGFARESASLKGGLMTTLILRALGPMRQQAADASGRISLESLRDWMHKEIARSDAFAAIRSHEKPSLYTSGGPTFYLSAAPPLRAAPAAGSAPRAAPQSIPAIKFQDHLWPDPISISVVKVALENGATEVAVEWPASTRTAVAAWHEVTRDMVTEKRRPAELQGKPREEIASLYEGFRALGDSSERIMKQVPVRLLLTWKSAHRYSHAIDNTLRNFLAWANLRVWFDLANHMKFFTPDWARLRVPEVLLSWIPAFQDDRHDTFMRTCFAKLFGITEPVYDAEVLEVSGVAIDSSFCAYGPQRLVKEASNCSAWDKPITNGWYFKYLVPQLELRLAMSADPRAIPYSERAVLRTLHDQDGKRVRD